MALTIDRKPGKHICVARTPLRLHWVRVSNRYALMKVAVSDCSKKKGSVGSTAKGHRSIVELKLHISHSSDFNDDGYSRNRDSFEFFYCLSRRRMRGTL